MPAPSAPAATSSGTATTGRIVSVVVFTFICYLIIGIPLPVLPGFVHAATTAGCALVPSTSYTGLGAR